MFVAAVTLFVLLQQTHAEESSSYGKEFYIGFMSSNFSSLRLLIGTTANRDVDYVVEANEEKLQTGIVSFGTPAIVDISSKFELQVTNSDFTNRNKGIHVYTTGPGNETIFVLAEAFVPGRNHGVFLAYPCQSIETDAGYEYYVISTTAFAGFPRSQFLVVGCEDYTTMAITPTQSVTLPKILRPQMTTNMYETVDPNVASNEIVFDQMQTLLVTNTKDLTGTKVLSSKPLTVISGNECANIPFTESDCEPSAFQVPPSATWGIKFLLAPFAGRNTTEHIIKVISFEKTSLRYTCGSSVYGALDVTSLEFLIGNGEYCYLESSKPILVVQLSLGGGTDNLGDSAIAMISPIDHYINEITFLSLQTNTFPSNYISVTVLAEHYDPNKILLDNVVIDCEWNAILATSNEGDEDEANIVGYGCSKEVSSNDDTPKQHTVSHMDADGLVSVLVYGFNRNLSLSYAYLAGQNLMTTKQGDVEIVLDVDHLPFVNITKFPGTIELSNTNPDATSEPIPIPDGFIFGDKLVTSAFVSENGVISFDDPWVFSNPENFPTTRQGLAVAPFWSDNDIRKTGTVRYATFCDRGVEAIGCDMTREGRAELRRVVDYVQRYVKEGESRFQGKWMLVAHWDHVPPSPHGDNDHRGIEEEELNKFNNYQAIIVSDVLRTYVVFSYKCGEMEWSALGTNRPAVVGYNAMGKYFYNHPLSGYAAIGKAVSCIFDLKKRPKRDDDLCPINNFGMQLPAGVAKVNEIRSCINTVELDQFYLIFTPIDELADMLSPCPCTKLQAEADIGQFRPQTDLPQCYVSTISINYFVVFSGIMTTLTQQCCYADNNALQTSSTGGFAGTFLLHHPVRDSENYMRTDKAFRDACCEIGSDLYCSKFFDRRIINNCAAYLPPGIANGFGDGHYTTFDGRFHSFQAIGDFTTLEVIDHSVGASLFTLQGRKNRTPFSGFSTFHQGLAFGQPNLAFQLANFRVFQTQPGPIMEITASLQEGLSWVDPTGSVELTKSSNTIRAVFYESGVVLYAREYTTSFYYINFDVWVPSSYRRNTRGLLGNFDGDPYNEFYNKGETTPLPSGLGENQLYPHLLTWRVNPDESLFVIPARRKRHTTADDFVLTSFDELNITNEHRMICGDNRQCLYDLALSGDVELAPNTLKHQKETSANTEVNVDGLPSRSPTVNANSMTFTSLTVKLDKFTPDIKQSFRQIAATAVTDYCSGVTCHVVLLDEKTQTRGVTDLKVDPTNIAIPTSLITEDDEGQLLFTIYVQLTDGVLAKRDLDSALMKAYGDVGFIEVLPITAEPKTQLGMTKGAKIVRTTTTASVEAPMQEAKPQDSWKRS